MKDSCDFVVFDVAAEYAHFRRPYTITTALTFPIPTRTALCGLVGAITGLPKNDALAELGDDKALFALQLLRPLRLGYISINLVDTKDNPTFRLKAENPHTIMKYEVIRDPVYRVFFAHLDLAPKLHEMLRRGESVYTPCCGLAWMIAKLDESPRQVRGTYASNSHAIVSVVTAVRTCALAGEVDWDEDGRYQRVRMPAEMHPDREVTRYEEYLIDTTARPIRAAIKEYWKLDDATVISPL